MRTSAPSSFASRIASAVVADFVRSASAFTSHGGRFHTTTGSAYLSRPFRVAITSIDLVAVVTSKVVRHPPSTSVHWTSVPSTDSLDSGAAWTQSTTFVSFSISQIGPRRICSQPAMRTSSISDSGSGSRVRSRHATSANEIPKMSSRRRTERLDLNRKLE